jgi:hypothetical protein
MATTEDIKGVSDVEVSEDGHQKPAAEASQSGITLIPHPSDDPRDPLVCVTRDLDCLRHDSLLNSITELAHEQEAQNSRSYLAGYLLRIFSMSCRSIAGRPTVEAVRQDYHSDCIPGKRSFAGNNEHSA